MEPHHQVIAQFENALKTCVDEWLCGNDAVALSDNLQELFGDMLFQYFERTLIEHVGEPVTFASSNDSVNHHTIVKLPKIKLPEFLSQPDVNVMAVAVGAKKAPRPMNCWIIFRDAMHRKLKADEPHLTIQEICKYTFPASPGGPNLTAS